MSFSLVQVEVDRSGNGCAVQVILDEDAGVLGIVDGYIDEVDTAAVEGRLERRHRAADGSPAGPWRRSFRHM